MPTADPKALDAQIRQKAVAEVARDIAKRVKSLNEAIGQHIHPQTIMVEMVPGSYTLAALLSRVSDVACDAMAKPVGDQAVVEFMRKVESLQEQLDELRETVEDANADR